MSDFNNIWFQRSKVALSRREQWKIYPNLVTEYLSCYLDLGVTIYCEQRFFIDEQISLTKNGGNETVKEKNYQPVMTWLCLGPGPQ